MSQQNQEAKHRVLRKKEVQSITGLSNSALRDRMLRNEFPQKISLGARAVGWIDSEIYAWLNQRIAERNNNQ